MGSDAQVEALEQGAAGERNTSIPLQCIGERALPAAEEEASASGAPRLEALDAQRWMASVQIIAFHFYNFTWGCVWTQFFFVLSGFLLAYAEMAKPAKQMSQYAYIRRRLVTIYPTYIFVLVLSELQWNHSAMDWLTLPLHLMLAQAWFPITYRMENNLIWSWTGMQWVQVSWFMSVLVLFWLILRPVVKIVRCFSLKVCAVCLGCLWAWSLVIWALGDVLLTGRYNCFPDQVNRCYSSIGMAILFQGWAGFLHVFLAGVVMARVFILTCTRDAATGAVPCQDTRKLALDAKRAPLVFRYGVTLGYLSFGLLAYFGGNQLYLSNRYFFHNGGILPCMLLLLVGGSIGADPLSTTFMQSRLFAVLGRMSYAQYLLQFNIWYLTLTYFPNQAEAQTIYPFALLLSAYFTERSITRAHTQWQRWRSSQGAPSSVGKALKVLQTRAQGLRSVMSCKGVPEEVDAEFAFHGSAGLPSTE